MAFGASCDTNITEVARLMDEFAERTGLTSDWRQKRYLWTDAFAVCNFLGLARSTGEQRHLELALQLCQNIKLRKSFHRLFQASDPQKVAITDAEIASALTLLVVFYCWTIPDAFAGLTGVDYVKYVLYYILSAGFFIYGFQRTRSAIKNYGASSTPAERITEA
jgi:hypothetical protein